MALVVALMVVVGTSLLCDEVIQVIPVQAQGLLDALPSQLQGTGGVHPIHRTPCSLNWNACVDLYDLLDVLRSVAQWF